MFRNPTTDVLIVLLIVLLIFGPKRLPGLGKQLGQGIREFKDSITGGKDSDEYEDEESERPQLTQPNAATPPVAPPAAPPAEAAPPAQASPGQTAPPAQAAPQAQPAPDGSSAPAAPEQAEVASSERRG